MTYQTGVIDSANNSRAEPDAPTEGTAALIGMLREGSVAVGQTDLRGANLVEQDLSGIDFSGRDLTGADLTGANLKGAKLPWADLSDASLSGADLSDCEFMSANLTRANLSECIAVRAGFGACNLTDANLAQSKIVGATFSKSTLINVDLRIADLRDARILDADLTCANLTGADLRGSNFANSTVSHAGFDETDLRHASLKGIRGFASASWVGADIRDVDFCGAYLVRRHIVDENYLHEFRNRDARSEFMYKVWWATSNCGRSLTRWSLWTVLAMALFAFAFAFVVGVDYGDHETWLSPLYYSVVTMTTLGYGDVVPATAAAQSVAMVEVVLGYVALGGLLSIFANKMARRAD